MMKARLVPIYFPDGRDQDFDVQLANLHEMLAGEVEILDPVPLGAPLPVTEAVVFPQLLGEAYQKLDAFQAIDVPILLITSEFGTMLMWDWEIANYLQAEGVKTIAPYNLAQTKMICHALAVKRELKETKFLIFQDNPGQLTLQQGGTESRLYQSRAQTVYEKLLAGGIPDGKIRITDGMPGGDGMASNSIIEILETERTEDMSQGIDMDFSTD